MYTWASSFWLTIGIQYKQKQSCSKTQIVRSHCSAITKQSCLIIAQNSNDQKEYINNENYSYKYFQACK